MKKTISRLCLLVGFVAMLSLMGCPSPVVNSSSSSSQGVDNSFMGMTVADGSIAVGFDFSGTFNPDTFGVTPFVVGDTSNNVATVTANWAGITNALSATGTGAAVLKKSSDGIYYFLIAANASPATNATTMTFKAANYATNDWASVVTNFWNVVGNQNTGVNNESVTFSNNLILFTTPPSGPRISNSLVNVMTNGVKIGTDLKRILIDVGAHGGWSIMTVGVLTNDVTLTMIWTNVPATRAFSGGVWNVFSATVSNTNTGVITSNATAVATGSLGALHTNATITWNPSAGKAITLSSTAMTGTLTITVPSGSAKSFQAKFANILGWNQGEEANNQAVILPAGSVVTQYMNFSK